MKYDNKSYFPVCKNNSLYGLAMDYISYCYGNKATSEHQEKILQSFAGLLNNGYCIDFIYNQLNNIIYNQYSNLSNIDYVVNNILQCYNNEINLLHTNSYRAHKELRLYSKSPVIQDSFDFNIFDNIDFEFYNEPIASYSLDDFMNYIDVNKFNVLCSKEKLLGGFKYILKSLIEKFQDSGIAINLMLFAYDEAVMSYKDRKFKDAFVISDYIDIAENKYKRTVNRIDTGDILFKYKPRLLFDRSGMVD